MVFLIDSCMQMAAMLGANLLKMVKMRCGEDCQFLKRLVMDEGSVTGAVVLPTQTPWVVYSMQRLSPRTWVGMATHLRWRRPSPPLLVDMLLMRSTRGGNELQLVRGEMKLMYIHVIELVVGLSQRCQLFGSLSPQGTSAANR